MFKILKENKQQMTEESLKSNKFSGCVSPSRNTRRGQPWGGGIRGRTRWWQLQTRHGKDPGNLLVLQPSRNKHLTWELARRAAWSRRGISAEKPSRNYRRNAGQASAGNRSCSACSSSCSSQTQAFASAGICVLHQLHQDWEHPPDLTCWLQCRGNGELLLGGKNSFCDIIVPWNAKETLFLNLPWSDALFTSLQEAVWWVHSFPGLMPTQARPCEQTTAETQVQKTTPQVISDPENFSQRSLVSLSCKIS